MKRFKFRFETVERFRKTKESEALRALASVQTHYQTALAFKNGLIEQQNQARIRLEMLGKENSNFQSVIAFQLESQFISGNTQRLIKADQWIFRAKRAVEKSLRFYLHARKQLKMIETLRERDFSEFKKQMAKKEQKDLDELNTMRARIVAEVRSA
jgi:flagellar export protein FliJ